MGPVVGFLAGDLLTLYLMLELVGACGALLVTLRGGVGSLLAGTRYFYAELAASTTMLAGLALVWSQAGTLVLADLDASLLQGGLGTVGLAAITVGPAAQGALGAPAPVAHARPQPRAERRQPAAVGGDGQGRLRRPAAGVGPGAARGAGARAAQLLGALGAFAVLWGSLLALRAAGLKQLIAASTVAQLGLLFLLFPLVVAGAADGWSGGVFLAVAHAPAKAAMLMAAAVVVDSARARAPRPPSWREPDPPRPTREGGATSWPVLDGLQGSAARRPTAVLAFGVAGLAMVGLPPSGGFVGKWYLLLGSVHAGQWWWVAVVVVGTLLTAAYLMRFVRPAMAPPQGTAVAERDARDVVALALAGLAVVLGLWPGPLLELLAIGGPGPGG
jgi:multicomponent Na+:H+ antiporter subunit D